MIIIIIDIKYKLSLSVFLNFIIIYLLLLSLLSQFLLLLLFILLFNNKFFVFVYYLYIIIINKPVNLYYINLLLALSYYLYFLTKILFSFINFYDFYLINLYWL